MPSSSHSITSKSLPAECIPRTPQDGIDALGNSAGLWPFGGGVEGALVHVAFDTTLVRFTASQLASLAALVRARKTVLSGGCGCWQGCGQAGALAAVLGCRFWHRKGGGAAASYGAEAAALHTGRPAVACGWKGGHGPVRPDPQAHMSGPPLT